MEYLLSISNQYNGQSTGVERGPISARELWPILIYYKDSGYHEQSIFRMDTLYNFGSHRVSCRICINSVKPNVDESIDMILVGKLSNNQVIGDDTYNLIILMNTPNMPYLVTLDCKKLFSKSTL